MSRFFLYEDLLERKLASEEDLQWLAGKIGGLPPFAEGAAVLCGSAAWGCMTWRSDIDVAHFATKEFPDISTSIRAVIAEYQERTQQRFIVPSVDVVVIGGEEERVIKSRLSSGYNFEKVKPKRGVREKKTVRSLVASQQLRFSDHLGSLAELKGDPWRSFHKKYLSKAKKDRVYREEDTKQYVSWLTSQWKSQPLHRLSTGPSGIATEEQLKLVGLAENYATNLLRRLLGHQELYPVPDRRKDIWAAFEKAPELQKTFARLFEPFHSLGENYAELVASVLSGDGKLTGEQYYERIRDLAGTLPLAEIEEGTWTYFQEYNQRLESARMAEAEKTRKLQEEAEKREAEAQRAHLEAKRQAELEAHRAYVMSKSKLPWWLRWIK